MLHRLVYVASAEDDVEDFHVLRRAQAGPLHWVDCTALRQLVALMLWSAVRSPHFAGCSVPGTVVVGCTVATSSVSGSVRHARFCHGVRALTTLACACPQSIKMACVGRDSCAVRPGVFVPIDDLLHERKRRSVACSLV